MNEPKRFDTIEELRAYITNNKRRKEDIKLDYTEKNKKVDNTAYYFAKEKINENEEPLSRVIGHENQKKEIFNVINWFKRSKELSAKGISVPKGVILFGDPGNGKSLLMKEIIRYVDAPTFIFNGEQDNIVQGIIKTFKEAKDAGHAVIVFDELDLLINKERRVTRALQECLDGVESSDDVLVIAATNDIDDIPDALVRDGRLEKLIKVPYPNAEEAVAIIKSYFKALNLTLPEDFEEEEVGLALNRVSCASIKSIVNDIALRHDRETITGEMIFESIENITNRVKDRTEKTYLDDAIHEAGHAVMAKAYPEFFIINKLIIGNDGGRFTIKEVDRGLSTYEKLIANIKICMAGLVAEKVICGTGGAGALDDLQNARSLASQLFNLYGYDRIFKVLTIVGRGREESQIKRRERERKIERFLKKTEKQVTKYIKKNKTIIVTLGQALFEKGHLKSSEIHAIID